MEAVKSTFTLCTGSRMSPLFVKNRDMSSPLSARRAIDSAEGVRRFSEVLFI